MILAFWGNGCPQSVRHSFLFFCGATGHRIWVGPSVSFAKPGSVGSIPGIWLVVSPNSLGATAEKSSVFTMLTHVTSEGLKTYSGSNKIKHWYQKKPTDIYFNGGLEIFFWIQNMFFLIRQRADRNALARHSKASNQTISDRIDFDVWARLPLGEATQNMNPFRVGL
jgi:hypothetical protein